jgi:hypothetical protein
VVLPVSAQLGSDVLREWPTLLFMSWTFVCLLYGLKGNRWGAFCLAGVLSGLSFYVRPESVYLLAVGLIVLVFSLLMAGNGHGRAKWVLGLVALAAGCAIPLLIHAGYSGRFSTHYLGNYQDKAGTAMEGLMSGSDAAVDRAGVNKSRPSLAAYLYALNKSAGEILLWFFVPFWWIGLYCFLKNGGIPLVFRMLIGALVVLVPGIILFRFFCIESTLSRRWIFPLFCLTIFCIPAGIRQTVCWIGSKHSPTAAATNTRFLVIVLIGIALCVPKLIKPPGAGKEHYREAAGWLKDNTAPTARVCSFDRRIPFYGDRRYVLYEEDKRPLPMPSSEAFDSAGRFGSAAGKDTCLVRLTNGTLLVNETRLKPAANAFQDEGATESRPRPLHTCGTGDFNGDGMQDTLIRRTQDGTYRIRLMQGTSVIGERRIPARPQWHVDKIEDFNQDGKSDLLWHNDDAGVYMVRFMDGYSMLGQRPVLRADYLIIRATHEETEQLKAQGLSPDYTSAIASKGKRLQIFRIQ